MRLNLEQIEQILSWAEGLENEGLGFYGEDVKLKEELLAAKELLKDVENVGDLSDDSCSACNL